MPSACAWITSGTVADTRLVIDEKRQATRPAPACAKTWAFDLDSSKSQASTDLCGSTRSGPLLLADRAGAGHEFALADGSVCHSTGPPRPGTASRSRGRHAITRLACSSVSRRRARLAAA